MKINKKILTINIITCLIIFFCFEIAFYFKSKQVENIDNHNFINIPHNITYEELTKTQQNKINLDEQPIGLYNAGEEFENKNNSIIIAGCSFAYSYGLTYGNTLTYKLAQKTKRPIYNVAKPASGPNETLYIFSNEKFYSTYKQPEYIIYLFIENHFIRMFSKIYSLKSNKLKPLWNINNNFDAKQQFCWYKPLFLSHTFKYIYINFFKTVHKFANEEKLFRTMITIKKNINRHWPNTNFIIIRYSEPNIKTPYLFSPEITKKFQENGIIVLDADEIVFGKTQKRLIGKEYKQEDVHPSALAFELLATKLAEKINKKEI